MIEQFLASCGYSPLEIKCYIVIASYGPKPVSTIASLAQVDRTYAYRVIDRLSKDGLIEETLIKGIKQYVANQTEAFEYLVERQKHIVQNLESWLEQAKQQFVQLQSDNKVSAPELMLYQWVEGIKRIYDDMQKTINKHKLLSIGYLATWTFGSNAMALHEFESIHKGFRDMLIQQKVLVQARIWSGILVVDQVQTSDQKTELRELVPGLGSMHIYVIGSYVYMIQYKQIPVGIKIENGDMADMLSVMLKI